MPFDPPLAKMKQTQSVDVLTILSGPDSSVRGYGLPQLTDQFHDLLSVHYLILAWSSLKAVMKKFRKFDLIGTFDVDAELVI